MNFFYIFIILFIIFLIFQNFSKFTNTETNDSSKVLVFYSNRCGHCIRAMPEFKKANNKNSDVRLIDASELENTPLLKQYDIKGFPTIIKEDGTKFSGDRTADEILKFAAS